MFAFFGSLAWVVAGRLRGDADRAQFAHSIAIGFIRYLRGFLAADAD